jgi:hypothetical protein
MAKRLETEAEQRELFYEEQEQVNLRALAERLERVGAHEAAKSAALLLRRQAETAEPDI